MVNKIEYVWMNEGKRYEKKLNKSSTKNLMDAVIECYPNNNRIATKLSEVLPTTKKIVVNKDRAEENPENAFIICILEDERVETVYAPLTNRIIWNMFQEWGEGK